MWRQDLAILSPKGPRDNTCHLCASTEMRFCKQFVNARFCARFLGFHCVCSSHCCFCCWCSPITCCCFGGVVLVLFLLIFVFVLLQIPPKTFSLQFQRFFCPFLSQNPFLQNPSTTEVASWTEADSSGRRRCRRRECQQRHGRSSRRRGQPQTVHSWLGQHDCLTQPRSCGYSQVPEHSRRVATAASRLGRPAPSASKEARVSLTQRATETAAELRSIMREATEILQEDGAPAPGQLGPSGTRQSTPPLPAIHSRAPCQLHLLRKPPMRLRQIRGRYAKAAQKQASAGFQKQEAVADSWTATCTRQEREPTVDWTCRRLLDDASDFLTLFGDNGSKRNGCSASGVSCGCYEAANVRVHDNLRISGICVDMLACAFCVLVVL